MLRTWAGLLCAAATLLAWPSAQAHLMVAQHGILNLVGDGAFMVMSLPVSAFTGIDDDGDGALSVAELRAHIGDIESQVQSGVRLHDGAQDRPLQGVMLNLEPPDHAAGTAPQPATQIVVMGRFALGDPAADLSLRLDLFGKATSERSQRVQITRGQQARSLLLTPQRNQRPLWQSDWVLLADQMAGGIETWGSDASVATLATALIAAAVVTARWALQRRRRSADRQRLHHASNQPSTT